MYFYYVIGIGTVMEDSYTSKKIQKLFISSRKDVSIIVKYLGEIGGLIIIIYFVIII